MMGSTCRYGCSEPSTELEPDADISGIDVGLSNTISAFLTLCIVTILHILFRSPAPMQPAKLIELGFGRRNPIDTFVLLRRGRKCHGDLADGNKTMPRQRRIANALTHVIDHLRSSKS
ncbi:hypothetical protein ACN47E_000162 [Coniothyrium glycines]